MRLPLYSTLNSSISSLCDVIVNSRIAACKCCIMLKRNPDWVSRCFCGNIEEPVFLRLIDRSTKSKLMQDLFVSIVDAADAECITDRVFRTLTAFPKTSTREKIIISLSHKKLSEPQLLFLCNIGTEFECFFELAIIYYTEKFYSFDHMSAFFEKFKNGSFGYMYSELLTELLENYKASDEEKRMLVLAELSEF